MDGERDRIGKKGRGWEYFEGFTEGLKNRATAFIIKEYERARRLSDARSLDQAASLILKIEGEVTMARELGLMTKGQAKRIYNKYSKDEE